MVAKQTRKCRRQGFFLVSKLARIFGVNFHASWLPFLVAVAVCLTSSACPVEIRCFIRAVTSLSVNGNLPWFNVWKGRLATQEI